MRRCTASAGMLAIGLALAFAGPAIGDQPPDEVEPAATVKAEGNVFTGGLQFDPVDVSVRVGDVVRWVNTDDVVPHTATEDHELWDETGDYGDTPANPPGFGPGETRDRTFSAGGWSYFCRVHPVEMRGRVDVPVTLAMEKAKVRRKLRRRGGGTRTKVETRYRVQATWGAEQLPEGQVFEIQRKRNREDWVTLRRGSTRGLTARFSGDRRGTLWTYRARVKLADDPEIASDWSPLARIRSK